MQNATLNQRVVRSKGDYVVGRTGTVIAIDEAKGRANVAWDFDPKSWVKFDVIEPEAIPYEIIPGYEKIKNGRFEKWIRAKYQKK